MKDTPCIEILERFEHGNVIEIRNGIMFDFYQGLPRIV